MQTQNDTAKSMVEELFKQLEVKAAKKTSAGIKAKHLLEIVTQYKARIDAYFSQLSPKETRKNIKIVMSLISKTNRENFWSRDRLIGAKIGLPETLISDSENDDIKYLPSENSNEKHEKFKIIMQSLQDEHDALGFKYYIPRAYHFAKDLWEDTQLQITNSIEQRQKAVDSDNKDEIIALNKKITSLKDQAELWKSATKDIYIKQINSLMSEIRGSLNEIKDKIPASNKEAYKALFEWNQSINMHATSIDIKFYDKSISAIFKYKSLVDLCKVRGNNKKILDGIDQVRSVYGFSDQQHFREMELKNYVAQKVISKVEKIATKISNVESSTIQEATYKEKKAIQDLSKFIAKNNNSRLLDSEIEVASRQFLSGYRNAQQATDKDANHIANDAGVAQKKLLVETYLKALFSYTHLTQFKLGCLEKDKQLAKKKLKKFYQNIYPNLQEADKKRCNEFAKKHLKSFDHHKYINLNIRPIKPYISKVSFWKPLKSIVPHKMIFKSYFTPKTIAKKSAEKSYSVSQALALSQYKKLFSEDGPIKFATRDKNKMTRSEETADQLYSLSRKLFLGVKIDKGSNNVISNDSIATVTGHMDALVNHIANDLLSKNTAGEMVSSMKYWIEVAFQCHLRNDIFSAKAVIRGLNMTPVMRLFDVEKGGGLMKFLRDSFKTRLDILTKLYINENNAETNDNTGIPYLGDYLTKLQRAKDIAKLSETSKGADVEKIVSEIQNKKTMLERNNPADTTEKSFEIIPILKGEKDKKLDELYSLSYDWLKKGESIQITRESIKRENIKIDNSQIDTMQYAKGG